MLLGKMVIAMLDMLQHPPPEVVAHDGEDHVHDPLSWQALDVLVIWQVLPHLLDLVTLCEDALYAETFVHWNVEALSILGFDNYRHVRSQLDHLHFFVPLMRSLRK